ncbi:MAG: phosphoribosylformylglycinamidine synthase I [Aquificaceae bacterium]|nr:phosphoribosylformylglycinamidine synthase I [Aquificaceae bacterium]MCS7196993.1 phosphoribosylformylglycinamidine synthase I [Aquificaceae bacterium]MCX7989695.1 phosphoribosylformylglycinamidine synthase I [Aquificaceae bacterium]MDW8032741.1 phosphoribosylformylglycinamidine synthase I [Aquificaceae bacterium]MDW8294128.1 phosphoribosylformylglycinamidine synthase I [Aquificaceae bacterium]
MKFAVCVFPGSNCDYDTYYVIRDLLGQEVRFVDHNTRNLEGFDCVVIPGGFSFGDYLRAGVLASKTPLGHAIVDFAGKGGLVLGICNGFQVLTELHLLPGALLRNEGRDFLCRNVYLRVENNSLPFTRSFEKGEVIRLPIAHGEGRYYIGEEELKRMEEGGQVVLKYCDREGNVNPASNPNGSVGNVAGVCNRGGNVFGLMPHPERACEDLLGYRDGIILWHSLIA